ncbi:MAG: sialate O-acetylesterase [Planctomycetota bacterium]
MLRLFVVLLFSAVLMRAQESVFAPDAIFGSHMVLPADADVVLRGRGPAKKQVTAKPSWGDAVAATVGSDGRWQVAMPGAKRAVTGTLTLRCGELTKTLDDLIFGDVWLASGQSNMEMPVAPRGGLRGASDWEQVVASGSCPDLRVFTVERQIGEVPARDVVGRWQRCSPEAVRELSAVGYFFARDLVDAGHGPIGLVASSWGGTPVRSWMSREALRPSPEYRSQPQPPGNPTKTDKAVAQRTAFFDALDQREPLAKAMAVALPEKWSEQGLEKFDGVCDYTRRITLPKSFAGRDLVLELCAIDDMDRVFWNESLVASTVVAGRWNRKRSYRIAAADAAKAVAAGSVELRIQVVDTGGEGGFTGSGDAMRLTVADAASGASGAASPQVALAGPWQRSMVCKLSALPKFPRAAAAGGPRRPAVLYQGMIAPLLPFAFKGAIWYQGESDRGKPELYARTFPAMILDWRERIGGELPFFFVQIAPYAYGDVNNEATAELRAAQAAALELPATGMAVTLDVGNAKDIHPRAKAPVGKRLALLARSMVYGEDVVAAAPQAVAASLQDDGQVRVTFAPAVPLNRVAGKAKKTDLEGTSLFEVAGPNGSWQPATATLEGGELLLQCDGVAKAAGVRYAWSSAPVGELFGAGLPVAPFRLMIR